MSDEVPADIFIEVVEVYINQILYLRDIYPAQIFKKRRAYNTPIFASIFPPLNAYLHNVLRAARELHQQAELQRIQLIFYQSQAHQAFELYTFHLKERLPGQNMETAGSDDDIQVPIQPDDEFLLDFEEELRTSFYSMAKRMKTLPKLPPDTRFKVLLHTSQAGFIRLTQNSHYQDFPWLHESLHTEAPKSVLTLLPLTGIKKIGLSMAVELT